MTLLPEKCEQLARAFHLLGHPIRLEMMEIIMAHDPDQPGSEPMVPTIIASKTSRRLAVVSHYLCRMAEAGLLNRKVTGRYTFYSVNKPFMKELQRFF